MRARLLGDAARFRIGDKVWVELPLPRVENASCGTVDALGRNKVKIGGMGLMSGRWWPSQEVSNVSAEDAKHRRRVADDGL